MANKFKSYPAMSNLISEGQKRTEQRYVEFFPVFDGSINPSLLNHLNFKTDILLQEIYLTLPQNLFSILNQSF